MSIAAAGSSASTRSTVADRQLGQPPGQLRSPAAGSAGRGSRAPSGVRRRRRSQAVHPGLGAQVGHDLRAARRGTGRPPSRYVSRCSETRTLPCDSTPIASSTWDGRSVDDVQDEPDETAKPRRSSACSSASPSTYRQENVTRCGSRSTGSPTTSTSGTVGRDRGPDPVHQRATAGPPRPPPRPPPRAARPPPRRPPAGQRRRGPRPSRRRPATATPSGCPCGPPARPTPGGPPHLWALAVSTDQPGRHGHPADRLGRVHVAAARRPRRRPPRRLGDRLDRADLVAGARSARPAPPRARPPRPTARPGRAGRAGRPAPRRRSRRAPTCRRRRAAPPSARSPSARAIARPRRRPADRRARRRARRSVPLAVKVTSSGRTPSVSAIAARAASSSWRARRAWRRACRGRPSRRRARPAGPAARPDAAGRRWPRRSTPAARRRAAVAATRRRYRHGSPASVPAGDRGHPTPGRPTHGRVICDRR